MFTGIVTATFTIVAFEKRKASARLVLDFDVPHLHDLAIGASVAVNGTCLTVVSISGQHVAFDLSGETLRLTHFADKKPGDRVHVERAARAHAEVGGHAVSGHVDGLATVVDMVRDEENCTLRIQLPTELLPYAFNKGYIALDGCSLTIANLDKASGQFNVHLIPETLRQTTFQFAHPGQRLNVEIDRQTQILVDTIREAVHAAINR